jgi:hypothetical protein
LAQDVLAVTQSAILLLLLYLDTMRWVLIAFVLVEPKRKKYHSSGGLFKR